MEGRKGRAQECNLDDTLGGREGGQYEQRIRHHCSRHSLNGSGSNMFPSQTSSLPRRNSAHKLLPTLLNNAFYLLVGQVHVELFIVYPLGADNWLGVLVCLQLLGVVVELQQLICRLQLGITRHLAVQKFPKLKY